LLRFSARLRQLPRNQAQYAANEAGMGGIFNELMLGPTELRKRLAEVYRLLPVTFDQSTQKAQDLQKQMALLKLQFEGIKLQIWNELEPAFMALFKLLMKGLNEVDWNAVAQWISNLVPSVQHLFHEVENLDTASGSWLKTLGLLAAAWLALSAVLAASPVGLVLLLAGSLLALYNDYETWKKGGKSLINWAQWKNEIDLAKAGIQGLITVLDALGHGQGRRLCRAKGRGDRQPEDGRGPARAGQPHLPRLRGDGPAGRLRPADRQEGRDRLREPRRVQRRPRHGLPERLGRRHRRSQGYPRG